MTSSDSSEPIQTNRSLDWPRAVLHVDMDAFFVNVHLLDHPEDKGLPIAVGGRPDGRGVVASASYEARRFGVRSAMPSSRALRLCPKIKFVSHNWPLIRDSSRQVMDILRRYGPTEQMSVDEAYIDLSEQEDPESIAFIIREQVKQETTLPASVGLATCKMVAKVSSDFDKPEGCTIIRPGDEAEFLAPLPVRALWGIGPRTAERLAAISVTTCGELAQANLYQLQVQIGNQAQELKNRAQGIDPRKVNSERGQAKSISQERTFNTDVDDREFLDEKMRVMSASVAESLHKNNLTARTVILKFRWADFSTFTRQKSVLAPIQDEDDIFQLGQAIFQEHWHGEKLRLLGIGVSGLEEPQNGRQLSLF